MCLLLYIYLMFYLLLIHILYKFFVHSNASKGMVADEKGKEILNEQGTTIDEDEETVA
jgi:hypothetical protein